MGDLRRLGPWGGPSGGNQWSFNVKGGIKQINITHGDVVDSILFKGDDGNGVLKDSEKFGGTGGSKTYKVIDAILKVVERDIGPWGGLGGKAWDDGVFSAAKQILVHVGNGGVIHALQFQYEKLDGKPFLTEKHGGLGGATIYRINLECASEFIAGITGFYGPIEGSNGLEAIRSICFHTNKGTYGPFGKEIGECFSSGFGGKVVGFHGRSNVYLDAIGVHMAYF
ncbi:hypothetical protein L1049_013003 [Liquidambar formosana]|uniref:Jacalin-type lectin domain-containing protein n=1 Tax=Liquidambar formosana TaxID=63359 RepID=A0AAP0WTP6_LIQFO